MVLVSGRDKVAARLPHQKYAVDRPEKEKDQPGKLRAGAYTIPFAYPSFTILIASEEWWAPTFTPYFNARDS